MLTPDALPVDENDDLQMLCDELRFSNWAQAKTDGGGADTADAEPVMIPASPVIAEPEAIPAEVEQIDFGTFGLCSGCHKALYAERLEYYPVGSLCLECQKLGGA